jgi:dihydropyrimidinase
MQPATDVVIVNGTVVNDGWSGPATVAITGERITHVLAPGEALPAAHAGTRTIDATGLLVIPGGVDPHTHINMSIGDWTSLDDYAAATSAAVLGGTTTVIDFAIPVPGQTPLAAVHERQAMAATGVCDAALHGCVVDWDDTTVDQLREMAELGVRTIKLFTTYRDVVMADSRTVLRVMEALRDLGGLAIVHAEANHLIEAREEELEESEGGLSAGNHAGTRSELSELDAVERVLAIAEHLGVQVYFVHQSTGEAVAAVREARGRGVQAYSETCPHYLALDSSEYAGPHPERFVCCPPLRRRETVESLRRATLSHDVHTVGSDHCCYDTEQKQSRSEDVRAMPAGLPGVETRLPVTWTTLVVEEGLPAERFVALVAANPARLNGLYPRKGVIAPGSDADVVLFDPAVARPARAAELHMLTDYSPYEGRILHGWPVTVLARGEVVVDDGQLVGSGPRGRAVPSAPVWGDGRLC